MHILDFNCNCFCVANNLIANQVEKLTDLVNEGVPWKVFNGQVTIRLEIDDSSDLFIKTRGAANVEARVNLAHVNLQILESEIDANVEIYPGGYGTPVRCHQSFLAGKNNKCTILILFAYIF